MRSTPFTSIWILRNVFEFREESWFGVFDKFNKVNFSTFSSIHLGQGFMFIISDVEVDMSENLTELFRRNFISSYLILTKSIPILEELFNIKSGSFTENSESLLHSFSYLNFFFGHTVFSLTEFKIDFWFVESWISFKHFCSVYLINFIANFHPLNISLFIRTEISCY